MRFNRRSLSFTAFALAMFAMVFAACTDDPTSPPITPEPPEPPVVTPPPFATDMIAVQCRYTAATRQVECGEAAPNLGDGARASTLIGGQNDNLRLISSNVTVNADTLAFDVQIQNLLDQPDSADGRKQTMGVDSLGVAGPTLIFFHQEPIGVGPTGGTIDAVNHDTVGTFTSGNQKYYQYNAQLDSGQISGARRWKLRFAPAEMNFTFELYVYTPVRLPWGWVNVEPDTVRLTPGSTATLDGTPVGFAGKPQVGKQVFWASDNDSVTVSAGGVVTAKNLPAGVTADTTTITATTPTPKQTGSAVVIVTPAAPDTFDAVTNVTVPVSAPALLGNPVATAGTVVVDTIATDSGGTVITQADGGFSYLSRAGYSGPDAFTYEVTKGNATLKVPAVVDVAPSNYWYVKADAPAGGDGRDRFPFASLAAAEAASAANDSIFVFHSATSLADSVALKSGQGLIGQGIADSVTVVLNEDTVVAFPGTQMSPNLTRATAGAAVTVTGNNHVAGLGITATNGAAIQGADFGTLTVSMTSVVAVGPALNLTNGTLAGTGFVTLSSTSSAGAGLVLGNIQGTLTANGGSITGAAGAGVQVTGGTVNFTYAGSIGATGPAAVITGRTGGTLTFSATVSGAGITIQNNTGGSVNFTGASKVVNTVGANAGVTLANNNGATVLFGGGGLAIGTEGGAAFTASGGGIVMVTGAGNTASTQTGIAVSLDGVDTGASGVTFAKVEKTESGGGASGIVLDALTGAGFQVTGTGAGTPGSGGVIRKTTSHGIHLTDLGATPVELAHVTVDSAGAGGSAGIFASVATDLTVTGVSVLAAGGPALSLDSTTLDVGSTFAELTSTGSPSSALILNRVRGAATAAAGTLSGAAGTTVAVIGGTLGFTYQGSVSQANNAQLLHVTNHSGGALSFSGTVQATSGTGLQFDNADGSYVFGGTTTLNGGDAGVDVLGGSTGTFTFSNATSITNPATGPALNVVASAPALSYAGTITNNVGRAVAVDGLTGGSVTIGGTVNSAGAAATGILVANNTGGSTHFIGTSTLSTVANDAVTLANNAAAAVVRFDAGPLSITTTTGTGFNANGGGTLAITGAGKTVSATGGTAVRILSTPIGADSVIFQSVSANGGAGGIVLQNIPSGTFKVAGGTIQNTTGPAVSLTTTPGGAVLNGMSLSAGAGALNAAIRGSSFGTLTVNGTSVTAGTGPALALSTGTLNGTFASVGGTAAGAVKGATLFDVGGSFAVSGGTITAGADSAVVVRGGTVSATWNGNVTQANGFPLLAVVGGHETGTLTFGGTLSATGGTGIQFNNADGIYAFNGTTTLNGGDAGIDLANASDGRFTFGVNTSVTGPNGGPALDVNGGTPALVYQGTLTHNTGRVASVQNVTADSVVVTGTVTSGTAVTPTGTGILVQNNSGGAKIAFNGASKSLSTGGNAAVSLVNNTGASISFGGGGLDIDTNGGNGITGTGGGTLQVTGSGNSINTSNARAVSLDGVSIGASGVSFQRIDGSGGSNGIFLKNTGSTNGLQVTGTNAAGTGGTIQNTVGADGTTAGVAVYLENTRNVVLKYMVLNNHPGFGIRGVGVNGLTVDNTVIAGTQGTNGDPNAGVADDDESAISIINLTGAALFTNDSISGGIEDNVRIMNAGVTADSIVFNNTRIGHANTTSGNTAVLVRVADGAVAPVRVRNSTFHGARNNMFHLNVVNTATTDLVLAGNTFHNTHPNILSGGGGVALTVSGTTSSTPVVTYNINNNSIRGARGVALNINKDVGLSDIRGTVNNNVIGQTGVANSGSTGGSGMQLRLQGGGTHRAVVTNNQIRQYNNYGLIMEMGDAAAGGGHGRMDVTMTGNTIKEPGTSAFPINAVHANIGTVGTVSSVDQHILCLNASGNNVTDGAPSTDVRLRQRFQTTFILQGYGGAISDNTAVNNFFAASNPGSPAAPTVAASNSVGVAAPNGPGNGFVNGTCQTP